MVLASDTRSMSLYDDRINLFSNYNDAMNNRYEPNDNDKRCLGVEDTGSIISDYTEDDIDPNDSMQDNQPQEQHQPTQSRQVYQPPAQVTSGTTISTSAATVGSSTTAKRARENDKENMFPVEGSSSKRLSINASPSAIKTITTFNLNEEGKPVSITAEIQQVQQQDTQKLGMVGASLKSNNKVGKKKRPSKEFLHRTFDESDESESFWNHSIIEEEIGSAGDDFVSGNLYPNLANMKLMTPIVEHAAPSVPQHQVESKKPPPSKIVTKKAISSSSATTPFKPSVGPTPSRPSGSSSQLLPLAKKYQKAHNFNRQVIINTEPCAHCDKKTKFGKMVLKCRECDLILHPECKDFYQKPCMSLMSFSEKGKYMTVYTNGKIDKETASMTGTVSDYVLAEDHPHVPPILQVMIYEIEHRALLPSNYEIGLYRVNGSDTQVKQLKERLFKRHQAPNFNKIGDVHVLCSFVKDFLNNLAEHLITYEAWERFARLCEVSNDTERMEHFKHAIVDLPKANRDTLAYMMLHIQRIGERAQCKMPPANLAKVFAPSIVGNSSTDLENPEIVKEIGIQQLIVENLIKIPSSFYMSYIDNNGCEEHHQRLFKNVAKTPDHMRKSKTAVVLSSILGPAGQQQQAPF